MAVRQGAARVLALWARLPSSPATPTLADALAAPLAAAGAALQQLQLRALGTSAKDAPSLPPQAAAREQEESGGEGEDKAAVEARKRRALRAYLEEQLAAGGADAERAALAALLQEHGVLVRGGQAEAVRLVEALQAWKRGDWRPAGEQPPPQ